MELKDIVMIAAIIFMIVCIAFENKLSLPYLHFGIFKRWQAWLFGFTTYGFILGLIMAFAKLPETGEIDKATAESACLLGVVAIVTGFVVLRKCPEGLRLTCAFDMIFAGIGMTFKFFIGLLIKTVWVYDSTGVSYLGNDGLTYVRHGKIWSVNGKILPKFKGDGSKVLKGSDGKIYSSNEIPKDQIGTDVNWETIHFVK
jgi:hypothetical protein